MRKKNRVRSWFGCAALLLALAAPAMAKLQVNGEDWGLGGAVKSGFWSVLYVQLNSVGEDFAGALEVTADAGQGVLPVFVKPVQLVADTPARHWVCFRAPASSYRGTTCTFTWQMRDARGRVAWTSQWQPKPDLFLPIADSVVAVFGTTDIGNAGLGGLLDVNSEVRVHTRMVQLRTAPDRVLGYESADALVWINPDPAQPPDPAQREAIVNYVRQGGHLVVAAGQGWQALSKSFLAPLLPAQPAGSFLAKSLPGLARYGPPQNPDPCPVMRLDGVRGEVVFEQDQAPLVVRGRAGLGRVTLIAFDPTQAPFAYFRERERFWADVLQVDTASRNQQAVGRATPVSNRMVMALNDFPGVKPINFWFVGVFLAGYVFLIGPVDYFVLKRIRRLHWTWISFPCVAVLFSAVAFLVMSSGRVVALASNSVSIVDAAQGEKEVFGTTFMTFLSPRQTHYNAGVAAPAAGVVTPLEYNFVGGMGGAPGLTQTRCVVLARGDRGERIDGLLVHVWDAQTVLSAWRAPAGSLPQVAVSPLAGGGYKVGVENKTPDHLTDARLILPEGVAQLGAIPSGGSRPAAPVQIESLERYVQQLGFGPETMDYGGGGGMRGYRGRMYNQGQLPRAEADRAARRISLFGGLPGAPAGVFRRWAAPEQAAGIEGLSFVFDLPARLQLARPGKGEAILLYSVDRPFADIELEGEHPTAWNATVVRLRVPVVAAPNPEEH